jgi:hypothetical protein
MLSTTTVTDMRNAGNKNSALGKKLAPNLFPKERYTAHIAALQYHLSIGGCIDKIHRALQFEQKPWLQSYIQFNTERRQEATNKFEKNYFKLMNNR